jgi:hypothetical protein
VVVVDPTNYELRFMASSISVTEIEREDWLSQQTPLDHIVEWWDHRVHGLHLEGQSENPILFPIDEALTNYIFSFREILARNGEPSDTERVLRDVACHIVALEAISYLESRAICHIGR